MDPKEIDQLIDNHFDPKSSTVNRIPDDIKQALGFLLSDEEIAGLVGAPKGSTIDMKSIAAYTITAGPNDPVDKIEDIPAGLLVSITNPLYIDGVNEACLYNAGNQTRGIYLKLIKFKKLSQPVKGFGALMIKSILKNAEQLRNRVPSFIEISMLAAGGRHWGDMEEGGRWSGYAVWPKYGFDMVLHAKTKLILKDFPEYPKNISSCKKVSDVLALGGGSVFWEAVGDGWNMNFDMSSANSPSIKTLDSYLKGVRSHDSSQKS